ncbi:interleukin-15 receptor subunit alpha-like isoform X1 [Oreochromis aureus]|uniref:Sushi domain-containing protein n=1 Tax=Oreochromis aureus TaxID=47969 RepID=A0AAZ1Y296_OREAU|nr:interleukin-15 receptor subunit alpha-like isoform X1 [Oreochromis aureus]
MWRTWFKSGSTCQMDLISLSFCVCIMIVCLPGAARFSSSDNSCQCPEIPQRNLTKPPQQGCFKIGSHFFYKCIDGYARVVGTSNFIKCVAKEVGVHWTEPTLQCTPDPRITTTRPTTTKVKAATFTTKMMQNVSTLPSVPGERDNIETYTHGKQHKVTPCLNTEPSKAATLASISVTVLLVILCSLGIIFLLYQRKSKKHIPLQTPDEVKPMNPAPSEVDL